MIANGVIATPSNNNGLIIANGVPQTRHNGLVIVNGLSERVDCYVGSPTARLSTIDGNAFAWISEKNLGLYLGHKVIFTDTAGKEATGWIKGVDAAEGLGAELVANGNMELTTNWNDYGTPTTNERSAEQKHGGSYSRKIVADVQYEGVKSDVFTLTTGKLYKVDYWTYGDAATNLYVVLYDGTTTHYSTLTGAGSVGYNFPAAFTQDTFYVVSTVGSATFRFNELTAVTHTGTWYLDDVSVKEVTHVGAAGVHIVSVKDGSTRNWASIDSGFDPNDISFAHVYAS